MAVMIGADPDLLEALAVDLNGAAERLAALQLAVRNRMQAAPWQGLRADRFRDEWDGVHRVAVLGATESLRGAADQVREQAADQRRTSAAGGAETGGATIGSATTGVSAVPGGDPSPGGDLAPGPVASDGPPRTVSAAGSGAFGPLQFEGEASASALTASVTAPEFTLSGPADESEVNVLGEVERSKTLAGASVETGAQAALVEAEAHGSADLGPGHAEGEASVFAGAQAKGEAGVEVSTDGVKAAVGASALVGVTAAASASAGAFGQSVKAEGHVTYGLELQAEAAAEVSYEHVEVSLELSAALGLGGGVKIGVELDPEQAVDELSALFDDLL